MDEQPVRVGRAAVSHYMTTLLYRTIGGLGRILIGLGTLILLFAGFQYWGTGLAEAQAQDELDAEFVARLASVSTEATAASDDELPDLEAAEPLTLPARAITPPMLDLADIPQTGQAAGRVVIPSIGVDKTYIQGVGRDDLRKGPGHYPLTSFPGQPGNAAIAGHRTTYGAPFHDLDKLAPGDEIIVETLQGRFTYLVNGHENDTGELAGHFIVDPTATWVLEDHGDSRLTLTACHPKRSAAQRIVVTATLDSTPAPKTPIPLDVAQPETTPSNDDLAGEEFGSVADDLIDDQSLEDSLGWQPQHRSVTAMWAAICSLIAGSGWVLGRRWRPVPAYLVLAGPFLGCLFVCFTHLDKLLPAI